MRADRLLHLFIELFAVPYHNHILYILYEMQAFLRSSKREIFHVAKYEISFWKFAPPPPDMSRTAKVKSSQNLRIFMNSHWITPDNVFRDTGASNEFFRKLMRFSKQQTFVNDITRSLLNTMHPPLYSGIALHCTSLPPPY